MSFLSQPQGPRRVPGKGPPNAKIAIVGEAPGAHEDAKLEPFVGPAGGVLEQCLHAAGLTRHEVYLTNVVKVRPPNNIINPYFDGKSFTLDGLEYVKQLREELNRIAPNIIVACGNTASVAITGHADITKFRGYVMETIELNTQKCIPCIHPAACLYRQKNKESATKFGSLKVKDVDPHVYRTIIVTDLKKAKIESGFPDLVRPPRQLIYNYANVEEVLSWLEYFADQPLVCFDIEVLNYEVSCISFSSSPDISASIPLAHTWSEGDEAAIWRGIQAVLGNENSVKVGQNLVFDTHFLLTRCGIEVRGPIQDTMIGHSIVFPELPKRLGFLGSVYCGSQAYWKDMVRFDDIKENS